MRVVYRGAIGADMLSANQEGLTVTWNCCTNLSKV